MLRDRLVCGINDSGIQRRLLAESDLTFKKALDLAQAIEAAERNIQDLQSSKFGSEKVLNIRGGRTKDPGYFMLSLSRKSQAADCRFKGASCHNCGKQGHIARAKARRFRHSFSQSRQAHQVQSQGGQDNDGSQDNEDFGEYSLFHTKDSNHRPKGYGGDKWG